MSGGLPMANKWAGPYGMYDIPPVIVWLANKVNEINSLPPVDMSACDIAQFQKILSSPGFKVVQEWGDWRDAEEEKSWPSHTKSHA